MKKLLVFLLSLFVIGTSFVPVEAKNKEKVDLAAKYAIAMDAKSGYIVYDKKIDEKMYPASMTKIVTIITALEMIDNLDETVIIQQRDIDTIFETGASAANFEVDELVTYRDIFMGAMLPSGADACRALAFNTVGSQEEFVKKMNQLVKKAGCKNTHFKNTTGIHHKNHYTTVRDMAVLTQYALKDERFRQIFTTTSYTSSNNKHTWSKKVLNTAKQNNIDYSIILGCKSGYTEKAKTTLSSLIEVDGHEYICVVGKCKNTDDYPSATIQDTNRIGKYIRRHYRPYKVFNNGDLIQEKKVRNGTKRSTPIYAKEDIVVPLPKGYKVEDIEFVYSMDQVYATVEKGQDLGTLEIKYGGEVLYKKRLVSSEKIEHDWVQHILQTFMAFMLPYGLIVIIFVVLLLVLRSYLRFKRRQRRKRRQEMLKRRQKRMQKKNG